MESMVPASKVTPASVGLRYGLLMGIVSVLLTFLTFTMQWQDNWGVLLLSGVILIGGQVLAQQEFKKRNGGFMSFGEGVVIGLVGSCLVGLLGAVFAYVYLTKSPDVIAQMLDKIRTSMEERGGLSDEQIDQGLAVTSRFMTPPLMAGATLLRAVFGGLVVGMIVAAFVKHTKPEFE